MYLMKPHDWKSSSSCWITWGLGAVPPLQIPPIPSIFSVCSIHLADPPACWIQLCLLMSTPIRLEEDHPALLTGLALNCWPFVPHAGPWCWLPVIAHFLVLSSPVLLDAFALPSPLETLLQHLCVCFTLGRVQFHRGCRGSEKDCPPLSPARGPAQASVPALSFLLSLWAHCPCSWLRLCWPACTHFRAFSDTQGHLFSSCSQPFCVIKCFLRLALPPTGASFPPAMLQQNSLK